MTQPIVNILRQIPQLSVQYNSAEITRIVNDLIIGIEQLKFDGKTGHKHTGVAGDAPVIPIGAITFNLLATGLTWTPLTSTLSLTTGYVIPTTTEETNWNTAYSNTNLWGGISLPNPLYAYGVFYSPDGFTIANSTIPEMYGIYLRDTVSGNHILLQSVGLTGGGYAIVLPPAHGTTNWLLGSTSSGTGGDSLGWFNPSALSVSYASTAGSASTCTTASNATNWGTYGFPTWAANSVLCTGAVSGIGWNNSAQMKSLLAYYTSGDSPSFGALTLTTVLAGITFHDQTLVTDGTNLVLNCPFKTYTQVSIFNPVASKTFILGAQNLTANYSWYLPATLPASTAFVKVDNSGNLTNDTTTYLTAITGAELDAVFSSNGFLKRTGTATYGIDSSTYITGNQSITLSSDVTGTGTTAITTTIATNAVTYAKFQKLSAPAILGRFSAGAGNVTELALDLTDTTRYLRKDGTWQTPSTALPSLASADIWVGNGSNAATAVAPSGDVTMDNTGKFTVGVNALNPTGAIVMFGGSTAPSGWVLCDGASYDHTNGVYTALYNVIGTTFGTTGGNNFNVPDFRGIFPKGAGTTGRTAGKDSNGNYYAGVLGTYLQDKLQGHTHGNGGRAAAENNGWASAPNSPPPYGLYTSAGTALTIMTDATNGAPRAGLTTEPQSLGITFIIKL